MRPGEVVKGDRIADRQVGKVERDFHRRADLEVGGTGTQPGPRARRSFSFSITHMSGRSVRPSIM